METKNCITCNRKAEIWTGHVVTKDGEKVIAGWCKKHYNQMRNNGLFGRWRKCMGKENSHG